LADEALKVCLLPRGQEQLRMVNDLKLEAQAAQAAFLDSADPESRLTVVRAVVLKISQAFGDLLENEEGLDEEELKKVHAYKTLRLVLDQNPKHKKYLKDRRAEIREQHDGKAALIGWTAVRSNAD